MKISFNGKLVQFPQKTQSKQINPNSSKINSEQIPFPKGMRGEVVPANILNHFEDIREAETKNWLDECINDAKADGVSNKAIIRILSTQQVQNDPLTVYGRYGKIKAVIETLKELDAPKMTIRKFITAKDDSGFNVFYNLKAPAELNYILNELKTTKTPEETDEQFNKKLRNFIESKNTYDNNILYSLNDESLKTIVDAYKSTNPTPKEIREFIGAKSEDGNILFRVTGDKLYIILNKFKDTKPSDKEYRDFLSATSKYGTNVLMESSESKLRTILKEYKSTNPSRNEYRNFIGNINKYGQTALFRKSQNDLELLLEEYKSTTPPKSQFRKFITSKKDFSKKTFLASSTTDAMTYSLKFFDQNKLLNEEVIKTFLPEVKRFKFSNIITGQNEINFLENKLKNCSKTAGNKVVNIGDL